ncbi:creatininase family protein [Siccirubricoccus phaeus]|uniref:creatininase family protein n=1 Tax=Siccirubricoccus phaeus TaxID=2595053 RepID=UPI0011F1FD71|nr:creatininase family protein [Siccirubricoccus phaeus]
MGKHRLEEMTFLEFRERMAEDPVILLPLGSVEVQGPCNPMGDYLLAGVLADRVAQQSGAIVAPTLPFGCADYFRDIPGGMQLSAPAFRAVLRDMLTGFLDHKLERLVIFNGHTGNNALIDEVTRQLRRERGVIIPWLNIWPMVPMALKEKAHGAAAPRVTGHGSDPIGSVYEYLFPQLTRREEAKRPEPKLTLLGLPTGGLATVKFGAVDVGVPVNMIDHCDATVGGDPSLANAEAGKLFADFIVETGVGLVKHMQTAPVRDGRAAF